MKKEYRDNWVNGIRVSMTYCDENGTILDMNPAAIEVFANDGGEKLIGQNVLDCHPGKSRDTLQNLLETHELNVYSIEKNGKKKLIYQAPVMDGDVYKGIVEISLPLPDDIPHFKRK